MLNTCHGWGISARAHVQKALLYLRNGSAVWVQFWCVSWGSWTRRLTQVKGGVSLHVRTCRPHFCISGTARPIGFNFGVWDGGHELGASHKSLVGYLCTCARADRTSISQDRLGRLCSNLVCGLWVTKYVLSTSHGWNGASLHMRTCTPPPPPPPYLRIWLTNFVKIWCVNRDPMVTRFTKVGGGVTAHSHVRLQFRYLGNRSALTLKPHQKQTYLFRARSFIAKHGVLLVTSDV